MQKATLLLGLGLSLGLTLNSSAALAAAPVFQLAAHDAGAQMMAIDKYPSGIERDTVLHGAQTSSLRSFNGGAVLTKAVYYASSGTGSDGGAELIPASAGTTRNTDGLRTAGNGTSTAATAASNDSMFYFLKNFRARPVQKPAHWTVFLVGLCFLLYQIRRRPMRASVDFQTASKLIGRRLGVGAGA